MEVLPAVLMISEHRPKRGKPLRVTRNQDDYYIHRQPFLELVFEETATPCGD
jgi:hypothetical protein